MTERFNPVNPVPPVRNATPARHADASHAGWHSVAGGPDPLKKETLISSSEHFSENQINLPFQDGPLQDGPRFNESDSRGKKFRNWLSKYGSSVILPLIAVLILAGGIYLYATKKTQETPLTQEEIPLQITGGISELTENKETAVPAEEVKPAEEIKKAEALEKTAETEIKAIIPEPTKKEGEIIEKAAKGEGTTHLARRAIKDYLKDRPQEKELTKEQKIYIEDYLKDRQNSKSLRVGDELSFKENLLKEAIDASFQLTPNQLKNLEKYSALVINW